MESQSTALSNSVLALQPSTLDRTQPGAQRQNTQRTPDQLLAQQPAALQRTLAQQPRRAGQALLHLQRRYGNHYVQRVVALAQQTDDEIARSGGITASGEVTPEIEQSIQQERGGGQALDSSLRKQMEPALGADFSGVRVHTDTKADTLNRSLNARAFATGQDIFFRAEAYHPGTSSGRELIAHELTHVVQQNGKRVQRKLAVSQPGDRFEQEADQVARAVMQSEQRFAQPGGQDNIASRQPEEDEQKVQKQPEEKKDESAQLRLDTLAIARQDEDEKQSAQTTFVQRQATDDEEKVQKQPEEEKDKSTPAVAPMQVARAVPNVAPAAPAAGAKSSKPGAEAAGDIASGVVDLKTIGGSYNQLPAPIVAWLESRGRKKSGKVNVHYGKLTGIGPILLQKTDDGIKLKEAATLPLNHPLFSGLGEGARSLLPHLNLEESTAITGHIGLGPKVTKATALAKQLQQQAELIGLRGLTVPEIPHIENKLEGGKLQLGPAEIPLQLDKVLNGKVSVQADDERVTKFEGNATAQILGLASGEVELKRSEQGIVTGKGTLDAQLTKSIAGKVNVLWDGEAVTGDGMVDYKGEKFTGQVNLQVMDKKQALQLAEQKQPAAPKAEASATPAGKRQRPTEYAIFGTGNLTFHFTDWLTGNAQVVLDPQGELTVVGKITPQKEVELLAQKDYNKDLFSLQATAGYGIPVVGRIGIFGKVELDAFAKLGPAKLYNIVIEGEYSTDPKKKNNFQIQGTLNISAAAGLRLRGEAGALLEILAHDIKAGAGINGIAGVRGYAEAKPTIGYREKAAEGEDKKGEFFIRGDLEIAAQPFLTLSGDLFIEIDAPWWSPVPDKKWVWPLGDKTWPIGGTFGINASVDYVLGSNQMPAIDFKPVEFSADKFMTDLYSDKAKASGEKAAEKAGEWKEKNSKAAEPPKEEKKGNAEPTKAPAKPAAQPTVQPGGGKKGAKSADPNERTAEGKTVKEYQEEARQKGGKPTGKEPKGGTAKAEPAAKDTTQQTHDAELQKGLAALDAVTKRYAEKGATKKEVETGVKAVRRKFKVFKSIEVVDGKDTWNYRYIASEGEQKGPSQKKDGETPDGTKGKPYWIKWHKDYSSEYPNITINKKNIKAYKELTDNDGPASIPINQETDISIDTDDKVRDKYLKTIEKIIQNSEERINKVTLLESDVANLRNAVDKSRTLLESESVRTEIANATEKVTAYHEEIETLKKLRKTLQYQMRKLQKKNSVSDDQPLIKEIEDKLDANRYAIDSNQSSLTMVESVLKKYKSIENRMKSDEKQITQIEEQIEKWKKFQTEFARLYELTKSDFAKLKDDFQQVGDIKTTDFKVGVVNNEYTISQETVLGPSIPSKLARITRITELYKELLEKAGFTNWRTFSPDHVKELSLGGTDRFENLWPYEKNAAPSQEINMTEGKHTLIAELKEGDKKESINNLKGKYFIIKGKYDPAEGK